MQSPHVEHHYPALPPLPTDWLVPHWPAPPQVQALCTSRSAGVSQGAYASMNLGTHVGDAPDAVERNRAVLAQHLGAQPVFLEQVHGLEVVQLPLQGAATDAVCVADAACTAQEGIACTVMVADCLPVLFCNTAGTRVAAAHAGWRGLLGHHGRGVLEATVHSLRQGSDAGGRPWPPGLLAWLGPCIGPRRFEVGPEVRQAFVQADARAATCFSAQGTDKWLADLPALARQRLAALGAVEVFGNDGSDAWCTVGQPSQFFSHRRDRISGRMAACIWLREP